MTSIKLLDKKTVEKIAAGEVIERPASIAKELIENSLDAGAKNIVVEIKDGGKSYIRVTDDGTGIDPEDIELAFKRHSTSKIVSLEDLYSITSLGFRGEALSSVSHVAKIEIMTKTEDSHSGLSALIEEGSVISKNIVGTPKGTTMIVRDLFYNLPVRKKFLKSNISESNQVTDIVYKIALGNSDVSFRLIKDNKITLKTSRNNRPLDHIYSVLGKEFKDNLINIRLKNENLSINGYISNNKLYRSNRSHQYIYVNGRYISNKDITDAIEKNYKSIIPLNRFPVFILFIDIDPKIIDINIHPTKQEIKFIDENIVFESLSKITEKNLRQAISIPQINFKKKSLKQENNLPNLFEISKSNNDKNKKNDIEKDLVVKDFTNNQVENKAIKFNENHTLVSREDSSFFIGEDECFEFQNVEILKNSNIDEIEDKNKARNNKLSDTRNILSNLKPLGVVFKTYILSEDKLNQKLYFIDQHAAHERVMYEKYLNEFKNEAINVQQLLVPEIIELTSLEMSKFSKNIDFFKALGLDVDKFGKNNIAIRAVPLVFGKPNIKNLFYDILDNMDNDVDSSYDFNLDRIMKLACTKAIKAGDSMSEIEIISLFEDLKKAKNPNSCPHGRPTILEMSKKDIEKGFLRIV